VRLIGQSESLSIHEQSFRELNHLMGPALRDKFLGSISLSAFDFVKATRWRREIIARTDAAVASCDAVICAGPMRLIPALNDQPGMVAYMLGSASCVFNVSGHPAAAICSGFDDRGLPLSLQIAGRYFDEATVLRAAAAYEAATKWTERHPSLRESPLPDPIPAVRPDADNILTAPSRDEVAAILRHMSVAGVDAAMIDRAHALCTRTAGMIARLPAVMPRDTDSAHVLQLPRSAG